MANAMKLLSYLCALALVAGVVSGRLSESLAAMLAVALAVPSPLASLVPRAAQLVRDAIGLGKDVKDAVKDSEDSKANEPPKS